MTIKHESGLFTDAVNSSEWDYVVKFWRPITESREIPTTCLDDGTLYVKEICRKYRITAEPLNTSFNSLLIGSSLSSTSSHNFLSAPEHKNLYWFRWKTSYGWNGWVSLALTTVQKVQSLDTFVPRLARNKSYFFFYCQYNITHMNKCIHWSLYLAVSTVLQKLTLLSSAFLYWTLAGIKIAMKLFLFL